MNTAGSLTILEHYGHPTTPVAPVPIVQPAPTPAPTPQVETFYDHEVWMVARKRENGVWCNDISLKNIWSWDWEYNCTTGHAFIGIIGRSSLNGNWKPIKTYSFWPNTNLTTIHAEDFKNLQAVINGQKISSQGQAVRKSRISASRANWIMNTAYTQAGCSSYKGVASLSTSCNCMDYSTRQWHYLTSGWEDYRSGLSNLRWSPNLLVDHMNSLTNQQGTSFLDQGKRWE